MLNVASLLAGPSRPIAGELAENRPTACGVLGLAGMSSAQFDGDRQALLDLAADRRRRRPGRTGAQQALADAVGTAREVVTRTIHDFRAAGFVHTTRTGIRLLDPHGLSVVAAIGEL
jgi:hypothetical protein